MPINEVWHSQNQMPRSATLDQKIEWHEAHAAHCRCREMPPRVLEEIERRRQSQREGSERK